MRTKWQLVISTIVMLISLPMVAQERGGQRGRPSGASRSGHDVDDTGVS